jgi:hypothetical protein
VVVAATFGIAAAALGGAVPAKAAVPASTLATVRVPTYGAYFGADPNPADGTDIVSQAKLLDVEIGRALGIVSIYTPFDVMPPVSQLEGVSQSGSIPMVSMHCGALDSSVAAGEYDIALRKLASDYRAFGRPVLLRWFWEMNLPNSGGHGACLGTNSATWSSDYIAAFRHIRNIFRSAGASNVSFIWCPSDAPGSRNNENVDEFFPGTSYVNWIAADLYDKPGLRVRTFESKFGPFYRYWSNPAHGGGLPIIITETGSAGTGQVSWLTSIETSFEAVFPDVHGVVYYDADAAYDWRLVPGTAGMNQFVSIGHSVYFNPFGPYTGFVTANRGGSVFPYNAPSYPGIEGKHGSSPIVAIADDGAGDGYWIAGANGSVYAFGKAKYFGSMGGKPLKSPIVGLAAMPDGDGYWLVAADGGIFAYGAARYHGSMGGHHLNKPIVGMASTSNLGYWLVAADGGIFTFGAAHFFGSTGSIHLHMPIDGLAATANGGGYWLVARDGGIFTFGDAHFLGSLGAAHLHYSVAGMAADASGGYRMVAANGTVYQFPGATAFPNGQDSPAVGIATA